MNLKSRQDGSISRAMILGHHRLLPSGAQREAKEQGDGTELCPPTRMWSGGTTQKMPSAEELGREGARLRPAANAQRGDGNSLLPHTTNIAAVTQPHAATSMRWDPCPALTGANHGVGGWENTRGSAPKSGWGNIWEWTLCGFVRANSH